MADKILKIDIVGNFFWPNVTADGQINGLLKPMERVQGSLLGPSMA